MDISWTTSNFRPIPVLMSIYTEGHFQALLYLGFSWRGDFQTCMVDGAKNGD